MHLADAPDLRANATNFFFSTLIAAINVVDAIENGFAIGDKSGNHQRSGGPQIGALDGGAAEWGLAAHDGAAAFDLDVRAHADEFLRVHEAVLKDVFSYD